MINNVNANSTTHVPFLRDSIAEYKRNNPNHGIVKFESLDKFNVNVNVTLSTDPDNLNRAYRTAPGALVGDNKLVLGTGSKVNLKNANGYSLLLGNEFETFIMRNGKALTSQDLALNPYLTERASYEYSKDIAIFVDGLRSFSSNFRQTSPNNANPIPPFINQNAERYLRDMGIDPSREFSVNGVRLMLDKNSGEIRRL
jgi:hypothetical protein